MTKTKRNILCIEDELHLRQDIIDELTAAGYRARGAADGRQALAMLDSERPDLILCDISMPHLDGFGFLEAVRARHPDLADVPLVFLTALHERESVIAGKLAGADDYLVKPIDYDLLLATVKARLDQVSRMDKKTERDIAALRKALSVPAAERRSGIERILDMLSFGVLIASRSKITFANQAAKDMHDAEDGLVLGGTLRVGSRVSSASLRALIETACAASARGEDYLASLCIPRRSSPQDLLLTVCSLPEPADAGPLDKLAVVFISDPARRPEVSNVILSDVFGLTPTEAEVASALAGGRRTDEIAQDLAISATTVAFHLRNLFDKTGTRRQADLIVLILTGLASIDPAQTASKRPAAP